MLPLARLTTFLFTLTGLACGTACECTATRCFCELTGPSAISAPPPSYLTFWSVVSASQGHTRGTPESGYTA